MPRPTDLRPSLLSALLHEPRTRPAWRWLLVALLLVIGWLAFGTPPPLPDMQGGDKFNHLLAFTTLGFVASFCHAPGWRNSLIAASSLLLYGAFIEVVQSHLPHRQGEWADLGADAVGLALGLLLAMAMRRTRRAGTPASTADNGRH